MRILSGLITKRLKMRGLKNKKALVTGGAVGIGRACVEALLVAGCDVTFCDRDAVDKYHLAEIKSSGESALYFLQGDMGSEDFCKELTNFANESMNGIDFLINNAFSFVAEGISATRAQWQQSLQVGPMAFATMIQKCSPIMKKSGGGSVVNLSSISAHIAQPNRWTYNAAKGAVDQLTKCSALDLAPFGIRVNSVSPGWIWSRAVEEAAGFDREKYEPVWGKYHMLRRCGLPQEVASAILFLLSDEASFITGTDLPVDGGYLGLGGEGLGEESNIPNID